MAMTTQTGTGGFLTGLNASTWTAVGNTSGATCWISVEGSDSDFVQVAFGSSSPAAGVFGHKLYASNRIIPLNDQAWVKASGPGVSLVVSY